MFVTSTLLMPPRPAEGTEPKDRSTRTVVIAVDGRPPSIAALTWTRDTLIEPDDRIRIVITYTSPAIASEVPARVENLEDAREFAKRAAHDAVREVFGTHHAGAEVEHVVEFAPIEHVLDEQAPDATLVVVGRRRRRRWRERFGVTTTNRLTGRISCPVIFAPEAGPAVPSRRHPSLRPASAG